MSFLLIEISSESAQFWGYPKNGTPELLSINGENLLPPYLYDQDGDLKISKYARERYTRHDPNAFGNFALSADKKQNFKGESRTLADIFVLALGPLLGASDQSELLNVYDDASLPVRLWFSPEVRKNANEFIDAFKRRNFENVCEYQQNQRLFELFSVKSRAITLCGVDGDLYIDVLDQNGAFQCETGKVLGAGADPRVQVLADLIFKDIHSSDPYIKEENEKSLIIEVAIKTLEKDSAIYRGNLHSSEGQNYGFKVKKIDVEKELRYKSDSAKIFGEIDVMAAKSNIDIDSDTPIFILGAAICTPNFSAQISDRYSNIHIIDGKLKKDLLRQSYEFEKRNDFKPLTNNDKSDPNDQKVKELIHEGDTYYKQGNLTLALYRYEEALNIDPSCAHCKSRIAQIKEKGDEPEKKTCPDCKKLFPTKDFAAHVSSCKGEVAPKRPCPKCKKLIAGSEFASHLKNCKPGPPPPPPRPCHKCKRMIPAADYSSHINSCKAQPKPAVKAAPKPPPPPPRPSKPVAKKDGQKPLGPPKPPPPPPRPSKPLSPKGKDGPPALPKPPPLKK